MSFSAFARLAQIAEGRVNDEKSQGCLEGIDTGVAAAPAHCTRNVCAKGAVRKHRPMIRDLVSIKLGGWPPCGYCELYRPLSRTCGGMKYELEPCRVMSRRIYLYFQDKEGKDE